MNARSAFSQFPFKISRSCSFCISAFSIFSCDEKAFESPDGKTKLTEMFEVASGNLMIKNVINCGKINDECLISAFIEVLSTNLL